MIVLVVVEMMIDDFEENDVRGDDNSDDNDDNQLWTTSNCHRPTNHPVTFHYPLSQRNVQDACNKDTLSQKSRKFPRSGTELLL